MMWHPW